MKTIHNLPVSADKYTPHPQIQEYFKILSPEFPSWLYDYINTKEMLRQQYISVTCGTIYSDLFESDFFYSNLDHSVGVALIVWHFTHDKKQTLSGLFHDIATPAFKHCVDFMNGDYMTQESTENLTTQIIQNSPAITALLARDKIKISEVDDYHKYPIADNDTPHLSADRLEYSLSNALFTYKLLDLEEIKTIYRDIKIGQGINGAPELEFKTKKITRQFVKITSILSVIYREDRTRYSMQFFADILKKLSSANLIQISDLYHLKETEIINIINQTDYASALNNWSNAKKVKTAKTAPKDAYYIKQPAKVRYIDPLCNGTRMSTSCKLAKKMIDKNLSYDMNSYVYLPDISL